MDSSNNDGSIIKKGGSIPNTRKKYGFGEHQNQLKIENNGQVKPNSRLQLKEDIIESEEEQSLNSEKP